MTEKPQDDIRNMTNSRLAELLELHNKWRRGEPPYDKPCSSPITPTVLGNVFDEAARRLRNIDNYKPSHFNSEDFEL